jgi:hypothetical protein
LDFRKGFTPVRLLLALLGLAFIAGCGPVQSTSALIDADVEIEGARAAGAQTSATYELTSAEAYLKKARELAGYSQYENAAVFAAKSRELAKEARVKALASSNRTEKEPAP